MDAYTCQAELSNMANALQSVDCREPLEVLRGLGIADVEYAFASRTSPDGQVWAPRKDSLPHPLLIKSGAMYAAATGRGSGFADLSTFNSIQMGITPGLVDHDKYQQFGTSRIPARPYMGMRESTVDRGAELVADHVLQKVFA
jgi:hypothetical protein